ncbi:hypothetical protein GWK47_001951 [Chionoecetes opilio]|uniref:Uncharacterized protein n=1 Tax=Chionoecetes opilio TaxID=41210 RepID=A0A8J4XRW8_CHIOP|nr:hypothetical protein GWK47_001951 [Chionoecetes opilio]
MSRNDRQLGSHPAWAPCWRDDVLLARFARFADSSSNVRFFIETKLNVGLTTGRTRAGAPNRSGSLFLFFGRGKQRAFPSERLPRLPTQRKGKDAPTFPDVLAPRGREEIFSSGCHLVTHFPLCPRRVVEKYLKILFFRDLSPRSPIRPFEELYPDGVSTGDKVVFSVIGVRALSQKMSHHGGHGRVNRGEHFLSFKGGEKTPGKPLCWKGVLGPISPVWGHKKILLLVAISN